VNSYNRSTDSNPLPESMTKPSIEEIMKYLTIITGCKRGEFTEQWIKKMTNWYLFTNPESEEFKSTPEKEKERLSKAWKEYMEENQCWISFFEWRKLTLSPIVQVTGETYDTPGHKWKSIDGTIIESKTTFPPFQGIILEDSSKQEKAIPLLTDEANQLSGIDKRVQSVSEKLNSTNTALRGMETQVYVPKNQVKPEQIYDLQVSTNTVVHSINQIHEKVVNIQDKVETTLHEVSFRSKEHQEELMDGLGTALTAIGQSLTDIKKKTIKEDKPIPSSFLLTSSHISILSPVYKPSEKTIKQKYPFFFPPERPQPESSKPPEDEPLSMVSIRRPAYEHIPPHSSRPAAPDLIGKGKVPEGQSYADE
jgi:tetrahydromethanopterin S-methyltransferase subunit G